MRGRNLLKRKGESWEGFTIRKEGDANHFQNRHSSAISTHTLRKEGDGRVPRLVQNLLISTHTLRKEGDMSILQYAAFAGDFNPHPPQGGCLYLLCYVFRIRLISTHTLRKEGDAGELMLYQ